MEVYTTPVHVRWSDQDVFGHVNNARLLTLLEDARIRFLTQVAAADGFPQFGAPKLVASQSINYRRPVHFGPEMLIDITVVRVGTKSYTLSYLGRQDGANVFDALTVMVPLTEAGGVPRLLTDEEKAYLSRFRHQSEPARV
jgi:acyl-CoA thioester hydrolase